MDPFAMIAAFAGAYTANYLFARDVREDLEELRCWCSGLASRVGYRQPPARLERSPKER
jgi:hypothetical protein